MHDDAIVIASPAAPAQLILLFHGVGSSAAHLVPVGEAMAQARREAMVVSVHGPHPSTLGSGREWFSVLGISERNRPDRIAQAVPLFLASVAHWQQASGVGPAGTALVGFSQGAILSLEATQVAPAPLVALQVVALAGRFAQPVRRAPQGLRFHLIHGEQDAVVQASHSQSAARELQALDGDVTLDLIAGLGHGIDARALKLAIGYLGADRP